MTIINSISLKERALLVSLKTCHCYSWCISYWMAFALSHCVHGKQTIERCSLTDVFNSNVTIFNVHKRRHSDVTVSPNKCCQVLQSKTLAKDCSQLAMSNQWTNKYNTNVLYSCTTFQFTALSANVNQSPWNGLSQLHASYYKYKPGQGQLLIEPHIWQISCHVSSLTW